MSVTSENIADALLSMDSYNRSENQGVFISGEPNVDSEESGTVGNAQIIKVSNAIDNTNNSFYAIAYRYPDGRVVISYRGTDNFTLDPLTGWSVGAGITANNQAPLAIEFFEDVVNSLSGSGGNYSIDKASTTSQQTLLNKITLTGHSLGGGLAGYVASLAHVDSVIFDHMPFGAAAWVTYAGDILDKVLNSPQALAALGVSSAITMTQLATFLPTTSQSALLQAINIAAPNRAAPPVWVGDVEGYFTSGEVNLGLRNGSIATLAGTVLGALINPVLAVVGSGISISQSMLDASVPKTEMPTFGWTDTDQIHRHSQALLVSLLYADKEGHTDWQNAKSSDAVLKALFNDDTGSAVEGEGKTNLKKALTGTTDGTGYVTTSDQMLRMIAYSAIETGTTVFGNTAIKALFNDADDLGRAITKSQTLAKGADALGQIIAQFAGQLAYNKIGYLGHEDVTDGVLSLSNDEQLLTVDLSSALWSESRGGGEQIDIVGRKNFIDAYVGGLDGISSGLSSQMAWLWNTANGDLITRFSVNLGNTAINDVLSDPGYAFKMAGEC